MPIPRTEVNRINQYILSLGYSNYKILLHDLRSNTVIEEGNLKYCVTGVTNKSYWIKNLNDRFFNEKLIKVIHDIDKYINNLKNKVVMINDDNHVVVSKAKNDDCKEIIIKNEDLNKLVKNILNKFTNKKYSFGTIEGLNTNIDINKILNLTITDKIYVINELLQLLKTNSKGSADLSLIGLSKNSGCMSISRNLKPGMKLISESVTGYYSKVLFEVK